MQIFSLASRMADTANKSVFYFQIYIDKNLSIYKGATPG